MRDYDTELNVLREKLARKLKIESMLTSLRTQLTQLKAEEQRLARIRSEEQTDVCRLEKASLASFFYAVINKKEEKLNKEKAEAYAAAVKHNAAVRQVEAAEYDLCALETELHGLSDAEMQYEKVFAAKAEAVKEDNPEYGAEICRIEDRLGCIAAQEHEIDEAHSAGRAALSQVSSIEGELDSAEGWGTWDLLGGGLISDLAKHSHLDDAQIQIDELQDQLRRYRTELADITVQADIQAQIDGFLRFADYFFDGLFADWAVLDSIHSSQEQLSSTRLQVEEVQRRLEAMKTSLCAETGSLKARLSEIVLKA